MGWPGRMLATALAVGAALIAMTGSAAAGSWAVDLAGFYPREGSEPQLAMAPDGEAVVVDEHFETIRAWLHTPQEDFAGGVFGEAVSPEESVCCRRPAAPTVAIDPSGDIVVAWQEEIESTGETGVYISFRPHGGSFSPPTLISRGTAPDVAVDAGGEVTASWLFDDGTDTVVEAAVAPMGGSFSSPVRLSGDGADAKDVQVSESLAGDSVVSWIRANQVEAAIRKAGGGFSGPNGLGEAKPTEPSEPPPQHIAMSASDEAIAVWEAPGGAVRAARLSAGRSTFGAAATLGTTPSSPWVAMDEAGEAVASWPVAGALEVATAPPGGSFGAPEEFVTEGTANFAKVAIAPDGAVTMAWLRNIAESPYSPGCRAIVESGSARPPGGTFAKPQGVSMSCGPTGSATGLEMAGDSAGDALAVWAEVTTIGEKVRGLVYDAGPNLGSPVIPAVAQVGRPVSFQMAPTSAWRPLAGTAWTFGDGGTAAGPTATHVYTQPGQYVVTASAADEQLLEPFHNHVENSVTRTITVTAGPTPSPERRTAPVVTHLRESHRAWREKIPPGHRSGPPVGTTFTFDLDEAAKVSFAFARLPGKCASRPQGRHPQCHQVSVGALSVAGKAGKNELHFRGRIAPTRWLAPGSYSVTITAKSHLGHSKPVTLRFTVKWS